jgi:hypothetical protein
MASCRIRRWTIAPVVAPAQLANMAFDKGPDQSTELQRPQRLPRGMPLFLRKANVI